jgi:hypothetical protein
MKTFTIYCERLGDGEEALKVSFYKADGMSVLGTILAPNAAQLRTQTGIPGAWLVVPTSDEAAPYPSALWLTADETIVRSIAGDYSMAWKAGPA